MKVVYKMEDKTNKQTKKKPQVHRFGLVVFIDVNIYQIFMLFNSNIK